VIALNTLSIVLPAKNEGASLSGLLPKLKGAFPEAEIIVVDDGSSDDTTEICERDGVVCVHHPYSMGNGAAIKSGARASSGDVIVFMDADSQHDPGDIQKLLDRLEEGYDMAVGARDASSQASFGRRVANGFYNRFASWMTEQKIADLTSGFRAVDANRFREFLHLLPNGFSYPTSITMAFFRAGYLVSYVPITAHRRIGKSHIRPVKDGIRFLLIIFKVGTLFSPLKIFVPIAGVFAGAGLLWYTYTFAQFGRFTNMSALLFINAVIVFLIGLVSEQITTLLYRDTPRRRRSDS